MTAFRFIRESLIFHRRINIAVALGVAAATAVLTGALLVGDSVRGSLRRLALDRLGNIDKVLVAPRFFRAADVATGDATAPGIMLRATLAAGRGESRHSADNVSVIGCDERFWNFDPSGQHPKIAAGEIVLNEPLADKLGAKTGDSIIVRLPMPSDIPAESALGRKTENVKSLPALKVSAIIPASGLGRFGLRPTQQLPLNAFVSLGTLQKGLVQPGGVNAVFAAAAADTSFAHFKLADYGLSLVETPGGYFNLTTDRMLLEPPIERAAEKVLQPLGGQPTFTYLANYVLAPDGKGKIPYSTITAMDLRTDPPLGPFLTSDGKPIEPLADDEMVLNSWAADDLAKQGVKLSPGDKIRLEYFEPESLHGEGREQSAEFRLKAIVALEDANGKSSPAADSNITPELKGVTDKKSIANWNPPFKFFPDRVRAKPPHDEDDRYWKKYHATPKAFVSLATGRRLWSSRFGNTTTWRIPAKPGMTAAGLADQLRAAIDPAQLGFTWLPAKEMGLQAASGTTPFNLLFLGFSFFIIAAAVMLVALLFKLGIDGRAAEIGTLAAVGFSRRKIRRMLVAEGVIVAIVGGLIGIAAGVGYAWLMLEGLRTWWLGAVTTPFLQLYVTPQSLAIGFAAGVLVSLATIAWTLRRQSQTSVRRLMSGESSEPHALGRRRTSWARIGGAVAIVLAMVLATGLGGRMSGEEQAGVFFGSGFLVLVGLLALVWDALRSDHCETGRPRGSLPRLAVRSGARNPLRSTLTIGLMAAASFLIVAISAFRVSPPETLSLHSGVGGFALFAQTDQPVYQDLNDPNGRSELGFDEDQDKLLANTQIIGLRVQAGDDASCLNLYQPQQPRMLGVPPALVKHDGFEWSATAAKTDAERANPWLLLESAASAREVADAPAPIPVVMDEATAAYSLHLSGVGSTYEITDGRGRKVPLVVVGLLANSIFQGDLLVNEEGFVRLFPDASGQRVFLIGPKDAAPGTEARRSQFASIDTATVRNALESALGDYGFDAEPTADRLAAFMAVQNTYLSTFQSLGGLGLLLGALGLAVVQLRSVFERRGELALMRAVGFRRRRLAGLVLLENAALLIGGLATGVIAALIAILPQLFGGSASTPWGSLVATLAAVLLFGLTAGLLAVRATVRAPLIPALREE